MVRGKEGRNEGSKEEGRKGMRKRKEKRKKGKKDRKYKKGRRKKEREMPCLT